MSLSFLAYNAVSRCQPPHRIRQMRTHECLHAGIQLLPLALPPPLLPSTFSVAKRDRVIRCLINWTVTSCIFCFCQPGGNLTSEAWFYIIIPETIPWKLMLLSPCPKVQDSSFLDGKYLLLLISFLACLASRSDFHIGSNCKDFSVLEAHPWSLTPVKATFWHFTSQALVFGCSMTELITLN